MMPDARHRVMPASVCLCVCMSVCVCVCAQGSSILGAVTRQTSSHEVLTEVFQVRGRRGPTSRQEIVAASETLAHSPHRPTDAAA